MAGSFNVSLHPESIRVLQNKAALSDVSSRIIRGTPNTKVAKKANYYKGKKDSKYSKLEE